MNKWILKRQQQLFQLPSSVQSHSHVRLSTTPWTAARQASLSVTNSQSFLTHVLWINDAIQPSHPLFSSYPQSLPAAGSFPVSQCFPSGGQSIGASASASVLPMNIPLTSFDIPKTSFKMDWLDLLAVQGTLKSLLQYHSSKASILRCSAFFRVQLSHAYKTTGKTIALIG